VTQMFGSSDVVCLRRSYRQIRIRIASYGHRNSRRETIKHSFHCTKKPTLRKLICAKNKTRNQIKKKSNRLKESALSKSNFTVSNVYLSVATAAFTPFSGQRSKHPTRPYLWSNPPSSTEGTPSSKL